MNEVTYNIDFSIYKNHPYYQNFSVTTDKITFYTNKEKS